MVFARCVYECGRGAIYVPEVGPMGDEFHETIEEAAASGVHWRWDEEFDEYICPECDRMFALDWPYVWRWRTMQDPNRPPGYRIPHPLAGRVGHRLRMRARSTAMNSALIEFLDGHKTVCSRNAIKRAPVPA